MQDDKTTDDEEGRACPATRASSALGDATEAFKPLEDHPAPGDTAAGRAPSRPTPGSVRDG